MKIPNLMKLWKQSNPILMPTISHSFSIVGFKKSSIVSKWGMWQGMSTLTSPLPQFTWLKDFKQLKWTTKMLSWSNSWSRCREVKVRVLHWEIVLIICTIIIATLLILSERKIKDFKMATDPKSKAERNKQWELILELIWLGMNSSTEMIWWRCIILL